MPDAAIEGAKARLRARLRAEARALTPGERARIDAAITRNVLALPAVARADAAFCYHALSWEVGTFAIIAGLQARGVPVALPRCDEETRTMTWYRVDLAESLERGPHGIAEPPARADRLMRPEGSARPVAIVPALALDRAGFRLGQGGGYYDRFLPGFPGVSVGVVPAARLLPSLEALGACGPHDAPVDIVITERGTGKTGSFVPPKTG